MTSLLLCLGISFPSSFLPASLQEEPPHPWTILIYGAADNNADGHMLDFLNGIRAAVADDPGLQLVLFIDRHTGFSSDAATLGENFTDARLYLLHEKTAERLDGGAEFPEITLHSTYEADSSDPENLRKFIAFSKRRFPARSYGLVIYGHADGMTMCPDEQCHRQMGIAELTEKVTEEESVDFMALELCNMGGVEIAYQWRPGNGGFSTEILVAIPNAGPPLDWHRIFARIHGRGHPTAAGRTDCIDPVEMSARDFGLLAVEEGGRGRLQAAAEHPEEAARESVGAYDLLAVEQVKQAVDDLARELAGGNTKDLFEELRGPGPRGTVMNYVRDRFGERPYVDLYDLLKRAAECDELDAEAREAARAAMEKTDDLVLASFGMSGYPGFEPGKNGVFIVFPDGDQTERRLFAADSRLWQRMDWYLPHGFKRDGASLGSWAWCRDGATAGNSIVENWFELLDSWFDDSSKDPEGLNSYAW